MESAQPTVYSLRMELLNVEPLIWRRVLIPSDIVLPRLHKVIQACMGWQDAHLHEFEFDGTKYGVPDPDGLHDQDVKDERGQRLDRLLKAGVTEFQYSYDFGDGWEHRVVVEDERQPRRLLGYPVCMAGERACPPEDVGGPYGYRDLLDAMQSEHEGEYDVDDEDNRVLWIGGFWDPEGFDVNAANKRLTKLRKLLVPLEST